MKDSALYIGPAIDTPNFRQITPKKGCNLSLVEQTANTRIAEFRVLVEQFFGRVLQKWVIPRGIYHWYHKHFQMNFENFCMLTNEDIKVFILYNLYCSFPYSQSQKKLILLN